MGLLAPKLELPFLGLIRVDTHPCLSSLGPPPPTVFVADPQQGRGAQLGCLYHWSAFPGLLNDPCLGAAGGLPSEGRRMKAY